MFCNWIVNIYNCDNTKIIFNLQIIGVSIHIILFIISIVLLIIQIKYFWKGMFKKDKFGEIYPVINDCIIIMFTVFNITRIIYMLCKILIKNKKYYWIITFFYNLPWAFINIGTFIFLWWISYCLHEQKLFINFRKIKIIIIIDILVSIAVTLPLSILLGIYFYDKIYNILFMIIHLYWGIMTLLFGVIILYIFIKILFLDNKIKKKLKKIIIIIVFSISGSLFIAPLWIIFGIFNYNIIYEWEKFSLMLFISWDIQCVPTLNIVIYIILLKNMYNFYKQNKHNLLKEDFELNN